MKKKQYTRTEMEIISFTREDAFATSGCPLDEGCQSDTGACPAYDPYETPIGQ